MSEIDELIAGSRAVGERPDLIQAGGGNTSVKVGSKMYIKASGTPLKAMSRTTGLAVIDLTTGQPTKQSIGRPSMETPMHSFLPKFVVHTHPVSVNVFTCSRGGRADLTEKFAELTPAWVDYATPGQPLATAIQDVWQPRQTVIFLENHGLITVGPTAEAALELTEMIVGACRAELEKFGCRPFTLDFPLRPTEQFLFPDAAVFGDKTATALSVAEREIMAAHCYIETAILKIGRQPQFLAGSEVTRLRNLDAEKYRKQLVDKP